MILACSVESLLTFIQALKVRRYQARDGTMQGENLVIRAVFLELLSVFHIVSTSCAEVPQWNFPHKPCCCPQSSLLGRLNWLITRLGHMYTQNALGEYTT